MSGTSLIMCIWLMTCLLPGCLFQDPQKESSKEEIFARSYLNKYGYLACGHSCTHEDLEASYRQLQSNFGLPATGTPDAETLVLMRMNRCGNADYPPTLGEHRVESQAQNETNGTAEEQQRDEEENSTTESNKSPVPTERAFDSENRNLLLREIRTIRGIPLISRLKRSVRPAGQKDGDRKTMTWTVVTLGGRIDWKFVVVKMALDMWSEVIPVRFEYRDVLDVDIIFAIIEQPGLFDSFTAIYPSFHAKFIRIYGNDLNAYTHVDLDLIHILVHNIGHCLGLWHEFSTFNVMYPVYKKGVSYEISREERTKAQQIHGKCKGSFDIVVDWDWTESYSTLFYRDGKMWTYSHGSGMPMLGVTSGSSPFFVDADDVLQVSSRNHYVFRGQKYYSYQDGSLITGYPKTIQEDLSCDNLTGPEAVDASCIISDLVYLFKDDKVWIYSLLDFGKNGSCPVAVESLAEVFNSSTTRQKFRVDSMTYAYKFQQFVIFAGEDLYAVEFSEEKNDRGFHPGQLTRLGYWYDYYNDIC